MSESFGKKLRQLRRDQRLGLRIAAGELGLSAAYLSRIEQGKEPPPRPEMIKKMAVLLGGEDILFSLAERTDPDLTAFLQNNSKARQLIRAVIKADLRDDEFESLIGFVKRKYLGPVSDSHIKKCGEREGNMPVQATWSSVWSKFMKNLASQPKCQRHPEFPCVKSMVQGVINDILSVEIGGIRVRSHRTNNVDWIPQERIRVWWDHLVVHGSASLIPGGENNPHPWRSRIVGAILATALPEEIDVESQNSILLR